MVAVSVLILIFEDFKRFRRHILCGWHTRENHGFVIWQCVQKIQHFHIFCIHQKRVIPHIHHAFARDAFDIRKIHHHAIFGGFLRDNVARKRDFKGVAVAMQIAALAFVMGDAMTSIEF